MRSLSGDTYARSGASENNQTTQIRSTLVAQCAGGVDQSTNTVALDCTSDERRAVGSGCTSGLLGLEEFLLGVCGLGALVSVTKDGSEDCEGDSVIEHGAEGDCRWLYWRKVCGSDVSKASAGFAL